ncbi:hypothetical protein Tco_0218624 [Tanacetum coccineum]
MVPVTQIDTFYNGLTLRHRDTINVAAGGTIMKGRPEECYNLIENMTAHHNDWDTSAQRGESSSSITSSSPEIAALTQKIVEINKNFLRMYQSNQLVNMVNPSCETCGVPHYYSKGQAAGGFIQGDLYAARGNYNMGGALPSNTIPNPREEVKVITTQSGMTLAGPSVPPPPPSSSSSKEVEQDPELTMDQVHISSSESTIRVPSLVVHPSPVPKSNEIPERNPHQPSIPYPSSELEECMALVVLGASINLMPLSVWKKLMLPELVPTRMTLELASRLVAYPARIAEDVFVQVGRPYLRMACALVDVHGEELILRVGDEKSSFNVDSTLKYPHKHGNESIDMIDIIESTCEDHFSKVFTIRKSNHPLSGSPTPSSDLIVASLTLFEDIDLLLEETDAFLAFDSI